MAETQQYYDDLLKNEGHEMAANQNLILSELNSCVNNLKISKLKLIRKLGYSESPVYLVHYPEMGQNCTLKLFPYEGEKICQKYLNEQRFKFLSHPNVISIYAFNDKQRCSGSKKYTVACILSEYAPYGDLAQLIINCNLPQNEPLIRTFFHHLISGLEYLHFQCVAHLDIKPQNLLIGRDMRLKIADFDISHYEGDTEIKAPGSLNYGAPELRTNTCRNPKAADIYSAGITLFTMIAGTIPYDENAEPNADGVHLFELMWAGDEKFWEHHKQVLGLENNFSEEFKELFLAMTKEDPEQRASFDKIKRSRWYNGPTLNYEECFDILQRTGVIEVESEQLFEEIKIEDMI